MYAVEVPAQPIDATQAVPFDLAPMDVAVLSGKNSGSPAESALTCGAQRRVTLLLASKEQHVTAVRIGREITIAVGLALILSQAAVAAPPDSPDPALAPWFESLKQLRAYVFRCSSNNGLCQDTSAFPLRATSGLMHRSKMYLYSITRGDFQRYYGTSIGAIDGQVAWSLTLDGKSGNEPQWRL